MTRDLRTDRIEEIKHRQQEQNRKGNLADVAKRTAEIREQQRTKTPEEKKDFVRKVEIFFTKMMLLKSRMLDRGLRVAWTWCPVCQEHNRHSRVNATLNGPKNHIHARCTICGMTAIE